ncbi:MAG TPA: anti-sigma factor [Ktedonobacterales bacterium]|nr:anti-sigma factor [Ktedonobacterales bacterium]
MQERHVDDLVDAYMLDALEPKEVDFVESHLEGCERCRALVDEARATRDVLLLAPPLAKPPADLRTRMLARIAEEVAANSQPQPQQSTSAPVAPPTPDNAFQHFMRSMLGGGDREERQAEKLMHVLLSNPHSVVWQVGGTEHAPHASGKLIGSPDLREAVLVVSGLDQPPQGHEYQVWFLHAGNPVPNIVFRVDRSGHAAPIVRVTEPLPDFDTVAVTPEPLGGSLGPTGPIVLAGSLTGGPPG